MKVLKACYVLLAAACVISLATLAIFAQDQKKEEAAPAAEQPQAAAPSDPVAEWKKLDGRIEEMRQSLAKLSKEFESLPNDNPRKKQIKEEVDTLLGEYHQQINPRRFEIAPKVYEVDPKQFLAGDYAMQRAMGENRFKDALALADKLQADGHKSQALVVIPGAAHFALHDFEKAKALFEQAEKDGQLNREGQMMLKSASDCIELWKQEQEILAAEAKAPPEKQNPQVVLNTSRGKVVLELFEDQAPNSVANFISLIDSKFYDGTKFHRIIPNFMAQGGDPDTKDNDPSNDTGSGGPGYAIDCECYAKNARNHFRGSLSMAHAGLNTGGSQFFITHQPTPHLNGKHTVFGRVVEGQDVVDSMQIGDTIDSATVLRKRDHEYKPVTHAEKKSPEKKS